MLYTYQTARLTLKNLNEDAAGLTTEFYVRNRDYFAPWEMSHPEAYFTSAYQRRVLEAEAVQFLRSEGARYYMFLPEREVPIGSLSFQHITPAPDASCQIGYRLDHEFTGCGYMTEALLAMIPKAFFHYHLHRMEANIQPENTASLKMMERLGFTFEGTARGRYLIGGTYRDHLRYSLLADDANFTSIYQ